MNGDERMAGIETFRVIVHREKDHLWAQVEEHPGCFASGRDVAELREALEDALSMVLSERPGDCRVEILDFLPAKLVPDVQEVPVRAQLVAA